MDIDYIHGCELLDLDIDFELCDAKKPVMVYKDLEN